ncbi:Bro-N domain-containing protein [Bacillus cereus]
MAKDVAEWIEHSNLTMMMKVVDEDEKIVIKVPTKKSLGGLQGNTEYTFLSEEGIYGVLMLSRKPIAKQWKKEVKKILKNIRLNGGHVQIDREEDEEEKLIGRLFLLDQNGNDR